MWSARRASFALILAATALLAACQVRPLYAPGPTGRSVQAELAAVSVAAPSTRPEQVFRNTLLFGLEEATPVPKRYDLRYSLSLASSSVGIESVTGVPTAYQISGTLNYVLTDAQTGERLTSGTIANVASYDRSSQTFANIRAERDAENRVATTIAGILKTRLAAFLATS
ncbi:LPS assembly lipoprotein LptE [Afifella pfennigii]|uniref:LPS assembly lipoprotein LptE n=1 Tax=Afifella pfennigii TaxID=209897 RepID=UPI00055306D7|nr:LPS assembly lipoprotein LptE [Afifella pfennigii]